MSTKKKTKRTKTKSEMWKLAFAAAVTGLTTNGVGYTADHTDETDDWHGAADVVKQAEKIADIADQRLN